MTDDDEERDPQVDRKEANVQAVIGLTLGLAALVYAWLSGDTWFGVTGAVVLFASAAFVFVRGVPLRGEMFSSDYGGD